MADAHDVQADQAYWDRLARYDPLWAILSDPSKTGRRWNLERFLETGRREVSLLMYQLRALGLDVPPGAALDFGCGIGRLTQPLAGYFDRVVGVDVSAEMIRLANDINQRPERVRYVCNVRSDLARFETGAFTFMYSNVVLQHVEPNKALQYLRELHRVVAPGGMLVFQLPSHLRPTAEPGTVSAPMIDEAYRATIRVDGDVPSTVAPWSQLMLTASVTNASRHRWSQPHAGTLRLGNHWLNRSARVMLIQDDGRAALPDVIEPGDTSRVAITVHAPRDPGEYQLEIDVVHEGISWFGDKGSETWRTTLRVDGAPFVQRSLEPPDEALGSDALSLPDLSSVETPGPLPMHGIHRDVVVRLVEEAGGTLIHVDVDERCGNEWVGYRYVVRKNDPTTADGTPPSAV
jgi:SAM-dependent methyltransferase